jgi:hypothetical protein
MLTTIFKGGWSLGPRPRLLTPSLRRLSKDCWCKHLFSIRCHGRPVSNIAAISVAMVIPMIGDIMFELSRPRLIWLIWRYLSLSERLFFIALCALGIYSLFLAVAVVRFRYASGDLNPSVSARKSLLRISNRVKNLQQATVAAFYLFGLVLFACFQSAYMVTGDSPVPTGWIVVRNFYIHFAFAANAFSVLLVIHIVQWFAANRVSAVSLQSNS